MQAPQAPRRRPSSPRHQQVREIPASYWSVPVEQLLDALRSSREGLSSAEARQHLEQYGPNRIAARQQVTILSLLWRQLGSPLVLILIVAAVISLGVGEWVDAGIVLAVVLGSALLGIAQEYRASNAVEKLRSQVTIKSAVLRDGQEQAIPAEELAPGDVVLLKAGALIPADGLVLEARDLYVNQAVLTGESFPVEKAPGTVAAEAGLTERTNCLWMGTSARSGTGRMLVLETGRSTEFGQVAERLSLRAPETDFERGVRRFGELLTRIMLVMVTTVLAINLFLHRPAHRFFSLRPGPGRGPYPRAAAGDHQHHARARRPADGQAGSDRAPAERHREPG